MEDARVKVSIVLPVFNEADSLVELYRQILASMEPSGMSFEIVFCDDGSSDESGKILEGFAKSDPRVKVLSFVRNYGQTAALDAGFRAASGEILVPMDSDLQNDPKDIPRLVRRLDDGFDVVSGWRHDRKDPFWTKVFPSRVANRLVSRVTGVRLHDYGCTLKAYRREILENHRLYGEMHRLIPAYAKQEGARVVEERVDHHARRHGRSKYTLTKSVRLILDLMTVRFLLGYATKPLYFIGKYALMTLAAGGASLGWSAFKRLVWGNPVFTDPFFLIGFILLLGGFQMLLFGLLAEMSMRTYYESQNKAPYVIRRTMNLVPERDPARIRGA
jgi:glycosyltransferase involved in cell wall biosynthesis